MTTNTIATTTLTFYWPYLDLPNIMRFINLTPQLCLECNAVYYSIDPNISNNTNYTVGCSTPTSINYIVSPRRYNSSTNIPDDQQYYLNIRNVICATFTSTCFTKNSHFIATIFKMDMSENMLRHDIKEFHMKSRRLPSSEELPNHLKMTEHIGGGYDIKGIYWFRFIIILLGIITWYPCWFMW